MRLGPDFSHDFLLENPNAKQNCFQIVMIFSLFSSAYF